MFGFSSTRGTRPRLSGPFGSARRGPPSGKPLVSPSHQPFGAGELDDVDGE